MAQCSVKGKDSNHCREHSLLESQEQSEPDLRRGRQGTWTQPQGTDTTLRGPEEGRETPCSQVGSACWDSSTSRPTFESQESPGIFGYACCRWVIDPEGPGMTPTCMVTKPLIKGLEFQVLTPGPSAGSLGPLSSELENWRLLGSHTSFVFSAEKKKKRKKENSISLLCKSQFTFSNRSWVQLESCCKEGGKTETQLPQPPPTSQAFVRNSCTGARLFQLSVPVTRPQGFFQEHLLLVSPSQDTGITALDRPWRCMHS